LSISVCNIVLWGKIKESTLLEGVVEQLIALIINL
jgi:hypothetical protein